MNIKAVRIPLGELDRGLRTLNAAKSSAKRPAQGWLRAVRESIGLGQQDVAGKLGVRRQSFADLEAAEKRGSATIASLERAAEAMGCELVYYLVPREPLASTYVELARRRNPKLRFQPESVRPLMGERQGRGSLPADDRSPTPQSEPFCLTLSQD